MLNPVREDDALGEALEAGVGLILGTQADGGAAVTALVRRLGVAPDQWLENVVLAPPCGLAGQSERAAGASLRAVVALAKQVAETVGGSA